MHFAFKYNLMRCIIALSPSEVCHAVKVVLPIRALRHSL